MDAFFQQFVLPEVNEAIIIFADESEFVRKKGETVFSRAKTNTEDTIIEYRTYLGRPSLGCIKRTPEKKDKLRSYPDILSTQIDLKFKITCEAFEVWFITENK